MQGIPVQLGRGSLIGLQQITRDGIHHAHVDSVYTHRFVLEETPVIQNAQQLHVRRRPRPTHFDQPDSLLPERPGDCLGFGMGDDVLRVCPKRLGQCYLQRPREWLDLLERAVLKNNTAFQAGLVFYTGGLGDRRREGKRPERPVADANGVN